MGKIFCIVVVSMFLVFKASTAQLPGGDDAITIDPHWEETETGGSVILQSPVITDWGRWGRLTHCSATHSYVTGFALKVEPKESGIDNTALNGIELSCGLPEQKEIERIRSAYGPWGVTGQRMFCATGYAVGFQLKVQKSQGRGIDDVATINARMMCENGQILEGWDEQGDFYVDTVWSDPVMCPEKMAICGIQTQIEPRRWLGDDTAMNNLRIECCPLPTDHMADEESTSSTTYNVTVFENEDGSGESETVELTDRKCNNLPFAWRNSVGSIFKQGNTSCIRLWEGTDCSRRSRCYCDSTNSLLTLNDNYTLAPGTSWNHRVRALGSCYLGKEKHSKKHAEVIVYSQKGFEGAHTGFILSPGECLTFYDGDSWRGQINSLQIHRGCINLYDRESCTGDTSRVDNTLFYVGEEWENKTVSIKNCFSNRQTDQTKSKMLTQ